MTYTYEQAIADAPKHVKRRSDLPTEVGWYVCLDEFGWFLIRWFGGDGFSACGTQSEADGNTLDFWSTTRTGKKIVGWVEPWWGR